MTSQGMVAAIEVLTTGQRRHAVCTRLNGGREKLASLWPAMCRPRLWDAPLQIQAAIVAGGARDRETG
jgi:hypothetical protein